MAIDLAKRLNLNFQGMIADGDAPPRKHAVNHYTAAKIPEEAVGGRYATRREALPRGLWPLP